MTTSPRLSEAERAKAATDAERQVKRTLDRHFRRPSTDLAPTRTGRSEA